MRKFALALLLLALPALAAEPSRREKIDKLVTLSHAEDVEKTALIVAIDVLVASATTAEQKDALQQLRTQAMAHSTRELWASAYDHALDDKALAETIAIYENPAAARATTVMVAMLPEAMHERLKPPATDADRNLNAARRTMADMRALAVALEARATDTNDYPESCDLETLRKLVEPTYIRRMPKRDAWGHEFLYIGSPGREGYRIVSAGADGTFESSSRTLVDTPLKPTDRFEDDLIYQNGEFIQAPRVLVDNKNE